MRRKRQHGVSARDTQKAFHRGWSQVFVWASHFSARDASAAKAPRFSRSRSSRSGSYRDAAGIHIRHGSVVLFPVTVDVRYPLKLGKLVKKLMEAIVNIRKRSSLPPLRDGWKDVITNNKGGLVFNGDLRRQPRSHCSRHFVEPPLVDPHAARG